MTQHLPQLLWHQKKTRKKKEALILYMILKGQHTQQRNKALVFVQQKAFLKIFSPHNLNYQRIQKRIYKEQANLAAKKPTKKHSQ